MSTKEKAPRIPCQVVFIDTNAFYDYNGLDQIKWREEVFRNADTVLIVVVPVNIREMNDHKDSGRKPYLAPLAASKLLYLDTLVGNTNTEGKAQIREGVEVLFEGHDARLTAPLNPLIDEDQLIGNILLYRSEHPDAAIVLLTNDVGLKIKAKQHGISLAVMPDQYRAKQPEDPQTKRIKALERQLEQLQRQPELSLTFSDNKSECRVSIPAPAEPKDIDAKVTEVKNKYPHLPAPYEQGPRTANPTASEMVEHIMANQLGMSRPVRELYNVELDLYYKQYRKYLVECHRIENLRRRTFPLDIFIRNDGTCPASRVRVRLLFPLGITVRDQATIKDPEVPKVPLKPGFSYPMGGSMTSIMPGFMTAAAIRPASPPNISSPYIDKLDDGYALVRIEVRIQDHKSRGRFQTLYITPDSDEAKSIKVGYQILAAELPEAVNGVLRVEIQQDTGSDPA